MNKCTWCGKHYSGSSVYRRNGNYCGNRCAVEFDNHEEAQRRQREAERRQWEADRPRREAAKKLQQEQLEKEKEIVTTERFMTLLDQSKKLGMTIPEYRDHLVNKGYIEIFKRSGGCAVFVALPLSFAFFYLTCSEHLLEPGYSRTMHGLIGSSFVTFVIFSAGTGLLGWARDKDVEVLDHFINILGRDYFTK